MLHILYALTFALYVSPAWNPDTSSFAIFVVVLTNTYPKPGIYTYTSYPAAFDTASHVKNTALFVMLDARKFLT